MKRECPVCDRDYQLTNDGRIRRHRGRRAETCPGGGRKPRRPAWWPRPRL
jgi:hypothetical protein